MQRVLSSKIMMIALLIILFLIAFSVMRGTVYERQANAQQVIKDIARDNVRPQTLLTPFIVVPVTTTTDCATASNKIKTCSKRQQVVITPEQLDWKNEVDVSDQSFKRGIYRAISYDNNVMMTGRFILNDKLLKPAPNQQVDWPNAKMRIYLSDSRGLKNSPVLTVNQQKFTFDFPEDEENNPLTIPYTQIGLTDLAKSPRFSFSINMEMTGTGSLQFLPLGKELSIAMSANWPHPSFFGESLPIKNMTSKDFSAHWENTYLANRNSQLLTDCMGSYAESCSALQQAFYRQASSGTGGYSETSANNAVLVGSFGVNFIQAVDVYVMTDRSIKYAALFLVITFGAFFLFEILKDLRIHPMQYALVGAALAVFYLLLLSFSEHINFIWAYGLSSAACISLLTFYISYVLKSVARSLFFSVILTAMYGTMFIILRSEDTTLVLGAVLVFVLIAVMMFLTRHVDWYELGQKTPL